MTFNYSSHLTMGCMPLSRDVKGTDINLAIHALTKAQANSFDVAYIMSADTDYIPIYRQLKTLGKITVVVVVDGQKISKIRPECDNCIFLNDDFFANHIRKKKEEIGG